MELMVDCDEQWKPWQDKCMADGETDGDCSVKAAILAQGAIILTGAAKRRGSLLSGTLFFAGRVTPLESMG